MHSSDFKIFMNKSNVMQCVLIFTLLLCKVFSTLQVTPVISFLALGYEPVRGLS
jgi:hypothetical protein